MPLHKTEIRKKFEEKLYEALQGCYRCDDASINDKKIDRLFKFIDQEIIQPYEKQLSKKERKIAKLKKEVGDNHETQRMSDLGSQMGR